MLTDFNPSAVYARVKSLGREERLAVYLKLKLTDKQQVHVEGRLKSDGPGKAAPKVNPVPPKPRVEAKPVSPPVPPKDEFSIGDDFNSDDSTEVRKPVEAKPKFVRDETFSIDPDHTIDHDLSADPHRTIDYTPPPAPVGRSRAGPVVEPAPKDVSEGDPQVTLAAQINPNDITPGEMADFKHIAVPGFDLIRKIGDGGQAVVFLATQQSTSRRVAIKLLRDGALAHENSRERHLREVRILASLDHPNIVGILDSGRTATNIDYLVMEYVEGESLDEYMRGYHRPDADDPAAILRLFIKICEAVNAAHRRGIVHRDLSPSNIRVDEKGEPHILDFGLARTAFDRFMQPDGRDISVSGQFLGKLAYASPEQARGDSNAIDIRTDVYALGVMLYQTLTGGRFPYVVVGNIRDVLDNIVNIQPAPPSKVIEPGGSKKRPPRHKKRLTLVNPVIEGIVLKALAKNPIKRHQSAGELARDLETYLAGGPIASSTSQEGGWNLRRLFGLGE